MLDELGHGDVLGLVDRSFPARRHGAPVVDLRGTDTAGAARALLSVLPLDSHVDAPVSRVQVDGAPDEVTPATAALVRAAELAEGRSVGVAALERFAFYERAAGARGFGQTGETVPHSCYLLRKGVVRGPGPGWLVPVGGRPYGDRTRTTRTSQGRRA